MRDIGFEPLALKYRPKRFSDFIGQQATRVVLEKMCREGKMDRPMVFAGVKGTGKTSAGRVVAAALNCEDLDSGMPCTKCPSCISIANGTSTDVIEQDGASSGLVDDIRKLTDMLRYSTSGRYRVLLLDEAQSLSKSAFNIGSSTAAWHATHKDLQDINEQIEKQEGLNTLESLVLPHK